MQDGIIIEGIKHVLVETNEVRYCNSCSLYHKCFIKRCPCHLFGVSIGWHFEIEK